MTGIRRPEDKTVFLSDFRKYYLIFATINYLAVKFVLSNYPLISKFIVKYQRVDDFAVLYSTTPDIVNDLSASLPDYAFHYIPWETIFEEKNKNSRHGIPFDVHGKSLTFAHFLQEGPYLRNICQILSFDFDSAMSWVSIRCKTLPPNCVVDEKIHNMEPKQLSIDGHEFAIYTVTDDTGCEIDVIKDNSIYYVLLHVSHELLDFLSPIPQCQVDDYFKVLPDTCKMVPVTWYELEDYVFPSEDLIIPTIEKAAFFEGFKVSWNEKDYKNGRVRGYCEYGHMRGNPQRSKKVDCPVTISGNNSDGPFKIAHRDVSHFGHTLKPELYYYALLPDDAAEYMRQLINDIHDLHDLSKALYERYGFIVPTAVLRSLRHDRSKVDPLQALREMMENDEQGIYHEVVDERNKLKAIITITKTEKETMERFGDVLLLDATHFKNNCGWQAMPMTTLDDNRNLALCGIFFIFSEDKETISGIMKWMVENTTMESRQPIYFSDDCTAVRVILDEMFPGRYMLCTWHKLRNMANHLKTEAGKQILELYKNLFRTLDGETYHLLKQQISQLKRQLSDEEREYLKAFVTPKLELLCRYEHINQMTLNLSSTAPAESMNHVLKLWEQDQNVDLCKARRDMTFEIHRMSTNQTWKRAKTQQVPYLSNLGFHFSPYINNMLYHSLLKAKDLTPTVLDDGRLRFFTQSGTFTCDRNHCSCNKVQRMGVPCSHLICANLPQFPFQLVHSRWMTECQLAFLNQPNIVPMDLPRVSAEHHRPTHEDPVAVAQRMKGTIYQFAAIIPNYMNIVERGVSAFKEDPYWMNEFVKLCWKCIQDKSKLSESVPLMPITHSGGHQQKGSMLKAPPQGTPKAISSQPSFLLEVLAHQYHDNTSDVPFPLHAACEEGNPVMLTQLINEGRNPNERNDNDETPLHIACRSSQFDIVKMLIEAHAEVNVTDGSGTTPLHNACSCHDLSIVEMLISCGADICAEDSQGRTPLHIACQYQIVGTIKHLLILGASANTPDRSGRTAIHVACSMETTSVLECLLAQKLEIDRKAEDGSTALHIACENGSHSIVRKLIKLNANPDIRNYSKMTPLHVACRHADINTVNCLIEAGVDLDTRNAQNETLLHSACRNGNLDIINRLIRAGVSVNSANDDGETPLFYACRFSNYDIVKALIEAQADVGCVDNSGASLLHAVCPRRKTDLIDLLIESHAPIDLRDQDGVRPLHLACSYLGNDTVTKLLQNGADADCPDNAGRTPIFMACARRNFTVMVTLGQMNVNIDRKYQSDKTLLNMACEMSDLDMVKLLVMMNARLDLRDSSGMTPLLCSCSRCDIDIVNLLVDGGAPICQDNGDGTTPLHVACCHHSSEIVQKLLDSGAFLSCVDGNGQTPLFNAVLHKEFTAARLLIELGADPCRSLLDKRFSTNEQIQYLIRNGMMY